MSPTHYLIKCEIYITILLCSIMSTNLLLWCYSEINHGPLGITMSSLDFILINMCVKVCWSLLMNSQAMAEKTCFVSDFWPATYDHFILESNWTDLKKFLQAFLRYLAHNNGTDGQTTWIHNTSGNGHCRGIIKKYSNWGNWNKNTFGDFGWKAKAVRRCRS